MATSYQKRKSDFENAVSLVVKTLRAQGATDDEIVTYLRLNLTPEPQPRTGVQTAIAKALQNPGSQFRLSDTEGLTKTRDFSGAGPSLIHNPHGDVPLGDPREQV